MLRKLPLRHAFGLLVGATVGCADPVAANVRRVIHATDLLRVVSQLPAAIAFLRIANATGGITQAALSPAFIPPNYPLELGGPAPALRAVISDFQSRVK